MRWLLESGRCEPTVFDAAGYAARLAARHSATDATDRISEMLQSYLLAKHYVAAQAHAAHAAHAADAAEAAEAAEAELAGQEFPALTAAAVVPRGAHDAEGEAARRGALEERFELAKRLFDRGLIDGSEWRAKKAALLEEL